MDAMLTDDEREALIDIFFTGHSDWFTSRGHDLFMTREYQEYGWQVPEVHREHDKALMQAVDAQVADLPLAIWQAGRIIEDAFGTDLQAA